MLAIPYFRQPKPGAPGPENLVFPVSIRFRCLRPECLVQRDGKEHHQCSGKYKTATGDRPRLYNTPDLLTPADTVCVTEGEFDAVAAHLCGLAAIGVPGAQSWKEHFAVPLVGYEVVHVLADGDEPGLSFAQTVAKALRGTARIVQMPAGEDVSSLVAREGRQALLERIR